MENPSHYLIDRDGNPLEAPPPTADPEIHLAWATLIAYGLAVHAAGADHGVEYDRAVQAYRDLCRQPRRES